MIDLDRPAAVAAAEAYLRLPRPLFTRIPFDYRRVPPRVRTQILRGLGRIRPATSRFPSWPIEDSIDRTPSGIDYAGYRAAVVITHDVDTSDEVDSIAAIRDVERSSGIVSAWGFVPEVSWPAEDLARGLEADGCEVYWHDLRHDGRLAYKSSVEILRDFERIDRLCGWSRMSVRAFRSGQLLMTAELMDAVSERFAIDLSIPDSERDGPYGGTAGCGTVIPFRFRGLLELPLTLPQDVFARHVMGLRAEQVLGLWLTKLEYIVSRGGVAILNTHPLWTSPRDPEMWDAYADFLVGLRRRADLLITTPSGVAEAITPVVGTATSEALRAPIPS